MRSGSSDCPIEAHHRDYPRSSGVRLSLDQSLAVTFKILLNCGTEACSVKLTLFAEKNTTVTAYACGLWRCNLWTHGPKAGF